VEVIKIIPKNLRNLVQEQDQDLQDIQTDKEIMIIEEKNLKEMRESLNHHQEIIQMSAEKMSQVLNK